MARETVFMSPQRIFAIAQNAFLESIRDRILYLIGFFLVLLLGACFLLPYLAALEGNKLILDFSLGVIHLFGLVVAVFVGTSLVNKEIEKRTIFTLISKPVSRAEFLVGKHLGLGGVVGVLLSLMTLLFFIVYALTQSGGELPVFPIVIATVFCYLELLIIVAVALFFGSFTSSVLASLFTFSLYLAGHFSQSLLQLGLLSKNAFIENLTRIIYYILPDLERLNLRNGAIHGLLPSTSELLVSFGYGCLYIALLLTAAHLIFSRREF
jgi:Cu-processing system permease protein